MTAGTIETRETERTTTLNVERRTLDTLDVPLGPARPTIRLTLTRHEDGEPEALRIAVGFGGGDSGDAFRLEHAVPIPGGALPKLIEALEELEETTE